MQRLPISEPEGKTLLKVLSSMNINRIIRKYNKHLSNNKFYNLEEMNKFFLLSHRLAKLTQEGIANVRIPTFIFKIELKF